MNSLTQARVEGRRRIYLAEFGLFENDSVQGRPPADQDEVVWRTEAVLESVKEFGASSGAVLAGAPPPSQARSDIAPRTARRTS